MKSLLFALVIIPLFRWNTPKKKEKKPGCMNGGWGVWPNGGKIVCGCGNFVMYVSWDIALEWEKCCNTQVQVSI